MAEERVERRLTAILAADVAGYSRLMAADEEGTLGTLKTLRREAIDTKDHMRSGPSNSMLSCGPTTPQDYRE
jgi:hypothetical protein